MQDEITQKIAVTLTGWQGQVTEAERTIARRKNATDLNAYDYWLLGIEAKHRMTVESQLEARAYFEKGLKLAPDFMPLVRDMGVTYSIGYGYRRERTTIRLGSRPRGNIRKERYASTRTTPYANFMMAVVYGKRAMRNRLKRHGIWRCSWGPTTLT